ncbi:hypothetical protein CHU98_g4855 [Xylaria longipes]|nr:hypothetical protein CHU98_g4855 [Xylaria longipes]
MAPAKQEKAPPYGKEEKVLCFHGDLMYEAKIIDVRVEPGKKADDAQYRIHYKGWKSSWDDWVTHDRIRKFTEDNKQLATQLAQARTRPPGSKGGKKGAKATGSEMSSARGSEERAAASSSFAGRGPRRGRDYELETDKSTSLVYALPSKRVQLRLHLYSSSHPGFLRTGYKPQETILLLPYDNSGAGLCESPGISCAHKVPAINSHRKQNLGCNMLSRMPLPPLRPKGFGPTTRQSAPFDSQPTPTTPNSFVTTGDWLPKPSESGGEKLPDREPPVTTIPMHIPEMQGVGTLEQELDVAAHRLMTPSLSPPLPAKVKSTTRCKSVISRKPATRGETALRKRSSRRNLVGKDAILMKTVPKECHSFLEKEMRWSDASADSDFMLRLPRPNHRYVDEKRRLAFNDSRFTTSEGKGKSVSFSSAGIPSEKPYAPYHEAASPPSQLSTLGSSEDPAFHGNANDASQEEAFHSRPSVKLIIPDVIKALLVDDWENVTKNMQLVPLPHPKPVTKILADYSAYEMPKRPAGSSHADILEETLSGLKEYFDKSLGRILLYKFERPQYAEVHKKWNSTDPEFQGKTASDIYGAEHLCRLIVSLPELIAQTNMDQQSVNRLREELAKFSTWLSKNTTEYFASSYETPVQDYVDKAKN